MEAVKCGGSNFNPNPSFFFVPLVDGECITGVQFTMGPSPFCIVYSKSLVEGVQIKCLQSNI